MTFNIYLFSFFHLFLYEKIPTAAAVPNIVAIIADKKASNKVFPSALRTELFLNSSEYQCSEKPSNTDVLFEELKENTTMTAKGAYKKKIISAIYNLEIIFILLYLRHLQRRIYS